MGARRTRPVQAIGAASYLSRSGIARNSWRHDHVLESALGYQSDRRAVRQEWELMEDQPTILWSLERDGRELACLVKLVPYGIEVHLTSDGETVVTRVF